MIIFIFILIPLILYFSSRYDKHISHISIVNKFFNELEALKQRPITNNDISQLQASYINTYEYFSKQVIKSEDANNFIYTYSNLFTLKEKWNRELIELEKANAEFTSKVNSATEFINAVNLYKQSYFTTSMRDNMIVHYKETYDFFNSPIAKKLNLQIPKEFIQTYSNLSKLVITWNFEYVKKELEKYKEFFDNIDGKSLDYQQRTAVVTDDSNNLILAGAGSGKTLTISAKVKYLVECKNVDPNDILLISFTRKAAEEMTERIHNKLNIPVNAVTFHKLGLNILNKYQKPNIVNNMDKVISDYFKTHIINDSKAIKYILDFFLYYLNIPKYIEDYASLGEYIDSERTNDFETLKSKYNELILDTRINDMKINLDTIKGEHVRSTEEAMIANFLFMNGINYEYEKEYPFKQGNSNKKYHPDFYLTDYDIYLEHFGISEDGRVPWLSEIEEQKYLDDMKWKRDFHAQNNTILIETYSYYNKEKRLLDELKILLEKHNIKFSPVNPNDVYNKVYAQNEDYHFKEFEKLITTFIQLYKANGYGTDDFDKLNTHSVDAYITKRNQIFISIVQPIFDYYENKLKEQNAIDFNDMINLATKYIQNEDIQFNYNYILIDEYQDISVGRYKLIKELIKKSNAKLICVGDDWQSIYRFSGSDLDIFSNFAKYFGETTTLKIEKTYRNSQELLDIATKFIEKNPEQLKKNLVSDKRINEPIMVMAYSKNEKQALQNAITDVYMHFGEEAEILLLGRTIYDINKFMDDELKYYPDTDKVLYSKYPKMNIKFLTVHSSKGLEADNVIILNMKNELLGFPNKISDDPVLSLVLQNKDEYMFAEERRLFYVAITRTRNKTYLIAPAERSSIFLNDLKKITNLNIYMNKDENTPESAPNCPRCKRGHLIIREKDGKTFLGCSNFPYCDYTLNNTEVLDTKIRCNMCGGYFVPRSGPHGDFMGCSNFPYCKNTDSNNKAKLGFHMD